MSVLDMFRRGKVPASATFRITEQGKEKLQEFGTDPKHRILMAMETSGTSNIEEISRSAQVSRGAVERMMPSLVRGGYVQYVGAGAAMTEDIG